jgi:hypothetical protein
MRMNIFIKIFLYIIKLESYQIKKREWMYLKNKIY